MRLNILVETISCYTQKGRHTMFEMTQLIGVLKHLFRDRSYGDSLQDYIAARNPQTPADVEALERQWHYGNSRNTGGQWL